MIQTWVFIITEALHIQFTNHHTCTFIKNKVDPIGLTKQNQYLPKYLLGSAHPWLRITGTESQLDGILSTHIQHIHTLQMILHTTPSNSEFSELVEWWIQSTDNERDEDHLKAIMFWIVCVVVHLRSVHSAPVYSPSVELPLPSTTQTPANEGCFKIAINTIEFIGIPLSFLSLSLPLCLWVYACRRGRKKSGNFTVS